MNCARHLAALVCEECSETQLAEAKARADSLAKEHQALWEAGNKLAEALDFMRENFPDVPDKLGMMADARAALLVWERVKRGEPAYKMTCEHGLHLFHYCHFCATKALKAKLSEAEARAQRAEANAAARLGKRETLFELKKRYLNQLSTLRTKADALAKALEDLEDDPAFGLFLGGHMDAVAKALAAYGDDQS